MPHLQSAVFRNTCCLSSPEFRLKQQSRSPRGKAEQHFPLKTVTAEQATILNENEENTVILSSFPSATTLLMCLNYSEIYTSLQLCSKNAKCPTEGFCHCP